MNAELMRYQAREIERLMAAKRLRVRVIGGICGHRLVVYDLVKPASVDLAAIQRQAEEIALALGVSDCRIARRNGRIAVEVPRRDAQVVNLSWLMDRTPQHEVVPVGINSAGLPLLLSFQSPNLAHVLICGTTGSGKTALARVMIAGLAMSHAVFEIGLVLIDPKRRGYVSFAGLPHLAHPVIHEPEEAVGALAWAVDEMERRDREGRNTPRLVIFIDELADLMLVAGAEVEAGLTRLVQRGREAGVHVVACTQKPTASVIGSLVKANFPARIVGRVVDTNDAYVASGISGTGAERLLGKGDFLVVAGGGIMRMQAAYISESEIEALVRQLRGGRAVTGDAPTHHGGKIVDFVRRFREKQAAEPANKKPPTEEMVEFALSELTAQGEVSQRAVRRFHREQYGSDCNPRRAQAAIDAALERRNGGTAGVASG